MVYQYKTICFPLYNLMPIYTWHNYLLNMNAEFIYSILFVSTHLVHRYFLYGNEYNLLFYSISAAKDFLFAFNMVIIDGHFEKLYLNQPYNRLLCLYNCIESSWFEVLKHPNIRRNSAASIIYNEKNNIHFSMDFFNYNNFCSRNWDTITWTKYNNNDYYPVCKYLFFGSVAGYGIYYSLYYGIWAIKCLSYIC
jgi:hypothetical protein